MAVLPFDAGVADDAVWLGEGMADDIIFAMSRFRDIAVIARNSSFRLKDEDLATLRDTLGADFLVQGSIRREGERLRLSVQLVDLASGINRWAERFERSYSSLPMVRDEIVAELAAVLAAETRDAVAERPTSVARTSAAYELALKARKALRSFDRERTFQAADLAQRAVDADPSYAVAWELLAQIHLQFYIQPHDERRGSPATLAQAREAAERAVMLDPSFSTALATLAGLMARDRDFDPALEMLRRALELNPSDATALAIYGDIASRAGDHVASLAAWRVVERLDPVGTPLALALRSRAEIFTGDLAEGLATARGCAAIAPRFQPCLVFLAIAASASGEDDLARETGSRLLAVNPGFTIDGHFRIVPFRRQEDLDFMASHLRTAGLPL